VIPSLRTAASRAGVVAFLALAVGCISSRGGLERENVLWTIGRTTRQDVVRAWGCPDVVIEDVWVWRNRKSSGGQLRASFWFLGATVRNLAYSTCEYRIAFGPDGKLVDEQVVDYTPGWNEWSLNPWN